MHCGVRAFDALNAELPQMMAEVLIRKSRPIVAGEFAKRSSR
jgi:hypothetical protein